MFMGDAAANHVPLYYSIDSPRNFAAQRAPVDFGFSFLFAHDALLKNLQVHVTYIMNFPSLRARIVRESKSAAESTIALWRALARDHVTRR